MSEVQLYSWGLCYASACAPERMTGEEVAAAVNGMHPTGLDHGWSISEDATFKNGSPNPCPCESDHARKHWLLSC